MKTGGSLTGQYDPYFARVPLAIFDGLGALTTPSQTIDAIAADMDSTYLKFSRAVDLWANILSGYPNWRDNLLRQAGATLLSWISLGKVSNDIEWKDVSAAESQYRVEMAAKVSAWKVQRTRAKALDSTDPVQKAMQDDYISTGRRLVGLLRQSVTDARWGQPAASYVPVLGGLVRGYLAILSKIRVTVIAVAASVARGADVVYEKGKELVESGAEGAAMAFDVMKFVAKWGVPLALGIVVLYFAGPQIGSAIGGTVRGYAGKRR